MEVTLYAALRFLTVVVGPTLIIIITSTSETIQLVIVLPISCLSRINICKHLRVEPKCDWFYEPCCLCDLLRPILDETQRPAHVWLKIAFYGVLGIDQLEWSLILELETSILNLNRFHNNPRMCYLSWAEPDIPKEDVFKQNGGFSLSDDDRATFADLDWLESNKPLCTLWQLDKEMKKKQKGLPTLDWLSWAINHSIYILWEATPLCSLSFSS